MNITWPSLIAMHRSPVNWRFHRGFEEERRDKLSRPTPFIELVQEVVDDAVVVRAIAEPGRSEGLRCCFQPVFFIDLPNAGDKLFNGCTGYRAQYWSDPWQGLAANGFLLSQLSAKLMLAIDTDDQPKLAEIDVKQSLSAASAKIWIREAPSTLEQRQDLRVEPWLSEAIKGVDLAVKGVSAPKVSKFEVKGALLDQFGNERVPRRKIGRHFDINHYGFS